MSDVDPKSIVAVPSPSNVASSEPFGSNRLTTIIALMLALPATTILPSGCTSTALTPPPPGSVTRPPLPKSGSSTPVARSRATTAPAAVERPAITMRPSAWRTIASPKSSPPKSIVAMPPVANVESSAPLGFRRATWMFPPSGPEKPPIRSLPFGATTTAVARPMTPQLRLFLPSPSKVGSSAPLAFRRTTATCRRESPASTILPSGWSAAPYTDSSSVPKSMTRLPPEPKVGSSVPLAARRRTMQNELAGPPPPAAMTRPLGWTRTTCA